MRILARHQGGAAVHRRTACRTKGVPELDWRVKGVAGRRFTADRPLMIWRWVHDGTHQLPLLKQLVLPQNITA